MPINVKGEFMSTTEKTSEKTSEGMKTNYNKKDEVLSKINFSAQSATSNEDKETLTIEVSFFEWASLIAQGHAAFQFLWSGIQFGVFELLEKSPSLSLEDIKNHTGLADNPVKMLMTSLTCLQFVSLSKDERYTNTAITKKFFVRSSQQNLIDVLGWQRFIVYPGIEDAEASLKADKNLGLEKIPGTASNFYQRISEHDHLRPVFQKAMSSLSTSSHQVLMNEMDLTGCNHLVDCGGGQGTNVIALAKKFPNVSRFTVFDQPDVCKMAKANILQNKLDHKINTLEGDLFKVSFPSIVDSVLLSHMLTIWSMENNVKLLKRAYEALPKGGKLFIFNMAVDDDQQGPFSSALGSLYFQCVATGQGRLYTNKEFIAMIEAAGFKLEKSKKLPQAHYLWTATK
jgi:ubiquinone/menaquinone biosynthesis C-methylase UbiE